MEPKVLKASRLGLTRGADLKQRQNVPVWRRGFWGLLQPQTLLHHVQEHVHRHELHGDLGFSPPPSHLSRPLLGCPSRGVRWGGGYGETRVRQETYGVMLVGRGVDCIQGNITNNIRETCQGSHEAATEGTGDGLAGLGGASQQHELLTHDEGGAERIYPAKFSLVYFDSDVAIPNVPSVREL